MIFGHDRWPDFVVKVVYLAIVLAVVFICRYVKKRRDNKNHAEKGNDSPTVDGKR